MIIDYFKIYDPLIIIAYLFIIYSILLIIKNFQANNYCNIFKLRYLLKLYYFLNYKNIKLIVMIALLMIFIISFIDYPLKLLAIKYYNQTLYIILDTFSQFANGMIFIAALVVLSLIFHLYNQHKYTILLQIAYMNTIYIALMNAILKLFFNRMRPAIINSVNFHDYNDYQNWQFFKLFRELYASNLHAIFINHKLLLKIFYDYNSMPSGHTIVVVAGLTPLLLYTNKISLKLCYILFIIVIALARIYTLNHWCSDTLFAAIFAFFVSKYMYKLNKYRLA